MQTSISHEYSYKYIAKYLHTNVNEPASNTQINYKYLSTRNLFNNIL